MIETERLILRLFRKELGIFPSWHKNKAHWLSMALDSTVENDKIRFLAGMSYELSKSEV